MRSLFAIFAFGFALSAGAGTNLVSNIAVITNWNKEIVTFQRNAGRFASVGIANVGTNLTEDFITSNDKSRYYRALPGHTVDGINECGVVAEVNVVDGQPQWRSGIPAASAIHPLGAVRWALDHGTSASMAASNLAERIKFPVGWNQNFHYMLADERETWIVENGVAHRIDTNAIMTNFRMFPTHTYGPGWERYSDLSNGAAITDVWFTRAYSQDTNWASEFKDAGEMAAAKAAWASHTKDELRGYGFWQTVHCSIYNITNRTLRIAVQEQNDWHSFSLSRNESDDNLPRYLHAISFDETYQDDAQWYYDQQTNYGGYCSARRIGGLLERNYDWKLDNMSEFVVFVSAKTGGTAHINDPSGRLIGTAEAKALQVAADAHQRMTEEAEAAAHTAMWRWDEFMATNNTMIIYISAGFGQDLIAMADNYCGWIAKSWYDGELDHYLIWFNRQTDFAPLMDFRFRRQGSTYWNYGTWVDWNTTVDIDGIPCHELTVPRKFYDSVLKTGSTICFGGREGFDADPHKCLISINGVNSLTSTPQCSFRTVVREGTNTVVKTYEMGYIKIENGIIKGALENE